MLSGMQLAPAIPMASYAPQTPVSHGPFLIPSAGVPAGMNPIFHQQLTAYPAAALAESRAPMGVPYFSGAGIPPRPNPLPLATSGILSQAMPAVSRQGKIQTGIQSYSFLYIIVKVVAYSRIVYSRCAQSKPFIYNAKLVFLAHAREPSIHGSR